MLGAHMPLCIICAVLGMKEEDSCPFVHSVLLPHLLSCATSSMRPLLAFLPPAPNAIGPVRLQGSPSTVLSSQLIQLCFMGKVCLPLPPSLGQLLHPHVTPLSLSPVST